MIFRKIMLLLLAVAAANLCQGQFTWGKITYERKTNLYKRYKDNEWSKEWIKESDKNKIDLFELYFNDSLSAFKPQESELRDKLSWTTTRNEVYQDFKKGTLFSVKELWGDKLYITDSLKRRTWKMTDHYRTICGFKCRKAICQVNDSIRIYAWYSDEIVTSTGPESFSGLPGGILGLATEDGGVIYFAKTFEKTRPEATLLLPPKTKSKIYTTVELRRKMEKDFGKEKWGKAMIREMFDIW